MKKVGNSVLCDNFSVPVLISYVDFHKKSPQCQHIFYAEKLLTEEFHPSYTCTHLLRVKTSLSPLKAFLLECCVNGYLWKVESDFGLCNRQTPLMYVHFWRLCLSIFILFQPSAHGMEEFFLLLTARMTHSA